MRGCLFVLKSSLERRDKLKRRFTLGARESIVKEEAFRVFSMVFRIFVRKMEKLTALFLRLLFF